MGCLGVTQAHQNMKFDRVMGCLGVTQAHQKMKLKFSETLLKSTDHICDGSKWPSKQRELQRQQILAEWQAVAARQEKNQKNCVDLQAALRVQREVDLAKQEEQAAELRYLVNKLTSNPCAVPEELALRLTQIEAVSKALIAASAADETHRGILRGGWTLTISCT